MFEFTLTEKQTEDAVKWMKDRKAYAGAAGGQFEFRFTPTGLGDVASIHNKLKEDDFLDLTDVSDW